MGASTIPEDSAATSSALASDERWLLVQRIAASTTFKRALRLREMLVFIVKFSLTQPSDQLREHEIAIGVLGRRDDFDPAYDNIVRVQAGHLRRKLHEYFETEGMGESLTLTLPKGSYLPAFVERPAKEIAPEMPAVEYPGDVLSQVTAPESVPERIQNPPGKWRWFAVACAAIAIVGLCFFTWRRGVNTSSAEDPDRSAISELMALMGHRGEKVAVVLPDTSLLMVQKVLNIEIPLDTYTSSSFPQNLAAQVEDPQLRKALGFVASVRSTTLNEAQVGMQFVQMLSKHGGQADLRYARDIRTRDLGEGNAILIGNPRSNPWVSLFTSRSNFVFVDDPKTQQYIFRNLHPGPGESAEYIPNDTPGGFDNYIDITLTSNLTDSGYVLIINGSDVPANEAAARFLLNGRFQDSLVTEFHKGTIRTLEVFLRGHHRHGESNDQLEIVTFRIQRK